MADPEPHIPELRPGEVPPKDWRGRIIDETFRQGPTFVILSAVLFAIGWIGYYSVTKAIPEHLESIKAGYKEVANEIGRATDRMSVAIDKDAARDAEQNKAILAKLDEINRTTRLNRPTVPAKGGEIIVEP